MLVAYPVSDILASTATKKYLFESSANEMRVDNCCEISTNALVGVILRNPFYLFIRGKHQVK